MSADHFNAKDRVFGAQSFAEVLWKLGENDWSVLLF
jgi:hypothetical protein